MTSRGSRGPTTDNSGRDLTNTVLRITIGSAARSHFRIDRTAGEIGDGVPAFNYTLHFECHGKSLVLRYRMFDAIEQLAPQVQDYLNTFAYEYNAV